MFEVIEIKGECLSCGSEDYLGNGLCRNCWDKNGELTKREREVLNRLSLGYENREIARKMFLDEKTIERHIYNIIQKTYIPEYFNKRVWLAINANRILGGNGHEPVS